MATWWGMRRLTGFLQTNVGSYSDTITHFETQQNVVALTIDDGLSRGGKETSLVKEVGDLLCRYNAHATFFVCTDYLTDQRDEALQLLENGHELGNHMEADKAFYYSRMSPEEFQTVLQKTNAELKLLDNNQDSSARWFRAPQGILTDSMKMVLAEEGNTTKHVLGDVYCDDWRFAQDVDKSGEERRRAIMRQAADLMLSQVQPGSIIILHMPEKGFRQGTLHALECVLDGLKERGLECVNLTTMDEMAACEKHDGISATTPANNKA